MTLGQARRRRPSEQTIMRPRGTGAAHVVDRLREEVLSLQLKPIAALDEVTLSDRFGLSRSPIREALIKLAGEGLVTIHTTARPPWRRSALRQFRTFSTRST